VDIQLGKPVLSSDGTYLGKVDRLVLDPATREFIEIVVHRGFLFSTDRIIEQPFINRVDADGVVWLNVTALRAKSLPIFYEHEYVVPTPEDASAAAFPVQLGVSGGSYSTMPILWRSSYSGRGYDPASRMMFEPPSISPAAIEVRSNLPDNSVVLDRGTDVVCKDGEKLGTVIDVVYGDHSELEAIVVGTGFRHLHRVYIPAALVESIGHDQVRILATETEARQLASSPVVEVA